MNKTTFIRRILVPLSFVFTLTLNGLANGLPINGLTTGAISDMFDVYFVPAAYVFSIWGLIYLALGAFTVYQALPQQMPNERLQRISGLFILSNLLNGAWILAWHYTQFALSVVIMLALLATLIGIYTRLGIGQTAVSNTAKLFSRLPFSIYLGWITVATIANITAFLDSINWSGWGISEITWTIIMLVVGTAVTAVVGLRRRDIAYMLVIVWAFAGIGIKHAGTAAVATTAWVLTALIVVLIALVIFRPKPIQHLLRPAN